MSVKYVCDGCGKEENAVFIKSNPTQWHKPEDWFQRSDQDGIQDACDRSCIEDIAKKSGKTCLVVPI